MRPGDKFILAYNELVEVLRTATNSDSRSSYYELLDRMTEIKPMIRHNVFFLKSMGDLRNAIVHDRDYPEVIVADPRQDVLDKLCKIVQAIKMPTTVIPKYQKSIKVFAPQQPLSEILAHMHKNDYSQVVLNINQEYQILSSEGIVRWLSNAQQIGIVDIDDTCVQDVYVHEEKTGHYMARSETIDAAILVYENLITKGIPRLPAILITNSGKPTEKPLGIITPWDLIGRSEIK